MPILQWLDRDKHVKAAEAVPYRLLEADETHSGGDADVPNMIIRGDNLEALKALLPYFAGRVKCIYIDPPYNTGAAFEHYDDNLENSKWLATIFPRLVLLRDFLCKSGSIWASIDNAQGAYLKVIMDEVFGRKNYITTCVWQQRTTRENRKVFSEDAEYIHLYAANPAAFKATRNKLILTAKVRARYKNPDNDPRGPWQSVSANAQDGRARNRGPVL
jgi:adenine-specific DNA-methyltransferase